MKPGRRSIPPMRLAMLVAIAGAWPPCPGGDACALGDWAEADCGCGRAGVGTWAGAECVHAAAIPISSTPVPRNARLSVTSVEERRAVSAANIAGTGRWRLAAGGWRLAAGSAGRVL